MMYRNYGGKGVVKMMYRNYGGEGGVKMMYRNYGGEGVVYYKEMAMQLHTACNCKSVCVCVTLASFPSRIKIEKVGPGRTLTSKIASTADR